MSQQADAGVTADKAVFPGAKSSFHGFDQYDFRAAGTDCKVVVPRVEADGKPWVWRARFWGHEPQFDVAMLERGYHLAYCDVSDLYGSPRAVKRWNDFYNYLRFEHLFADRAVLEGMSRGGLVVFNWASANPDKVACIYADHPVCDIRSWPGGKGAGSGSPADWERCLQVYGLSDEESKAFDGNPIDRLRPLADAGIRLLHVVGDADTDVPVEENTSVVERRYQALGGHIHVIHKPAVAHHPHSLEDPAPIVEFVLKGRDDRTLPRAEDIVSDTHFTPRSNFRNCRIPFERHRRGHVAFLGGSITEMDGYRPKVCSMLEQCFPCTEFTFTNAGISSTCSDTGAFRLKRDVLDHGPLDLLFVEFAVNDSGDAAGDYTDALRGMEGIIVQARRHNPNVDIVMTFFVTPDFVKQLRRGETPPPIAAHARVAEYYDVSVNHLARELTDLISAGRMDWAQFGGVHPNDYGNSMCACMINRALLRAWSTPLPVEANPSPYPERQPIDPFSYVHGRLLPFTDVETDSHWKRGVPDWPRENEGMVRPRFLDAPMIHSSRAGAKLTVNFSGSAIGAYILAGPDTGIVQCTIDGELTRELDTLHHFSRFNYPMTVMFFNELAAGRHKLELEILENRPGRNRPGGTAFRALAFTAN